MTEPDNKPGRDTIVPTPVAYRPAGARPATGHAPRRTLRALGLAAGAAALVGGVFAVFVWLPGQVAAPPPAAVAEAPAAPQAAAPAPKTAAPPRIDPDDPELMAARREAQELKRAAEAALAALEARAAAEWAPSDLAALRDDLAMGDAAYRELAFFDARRAFSAANDGAAALAERAASAFAEALAAGRAAFAAGDQAGARAAFELALTIEPGNPEAESGLVRTERLDEVLEAMDAAAAREAAGDVAGALAGYRAVLDIDPEYGPARERRERLAAEQTAQRFEQLMSQGYAALENGDLATARRRFAEAGGVRPGAAEVAEALRHVGVEERAARIADLERRGAAAAADEAWRDAEDAYAELLAMGVSDQAVEAALAEARERRALAEALTAALAAPGKLVTDDGLRQAESVLQKAAAISPQGPRLAERTRELANLIEVMRTPLPVRLTSDGETRVTVYRVGRLGRFEQHRLELLPGRYVAVGARQGFRDVRREFIVDPAAPPPVVDVRCVEPIVARR